MIRRAAVAAAVAAVLAAPAGAAVPGVAAIYVNYNADCTFTMSVDGGITAAPNATVPPGVYQLLVWLPNPNQGYSCGIPTFTFTGPGVSSTTVFRGQELHDEHVIPALQAGGHLRRVRRERTRLDAPRAHGGEPRARAAR